MFERGTIRVQEVRVGERVRFRDGIVAVRLDKESHLSSTFVFQGDRGEFQASTGCLVHAEIDNTRQG
jgi:hypothetical protein